jgi:hypothetical protein
MSKKLLIAVLTFGLLFAISGAVIGSDDTRPDPANAVTIGQGNPNGQDDKGFAVEERVVQSKGNIALAIPVKHWPPDVYCEFIDYSQGAWVAYGVIGGGPGELTNSWMRHTAAEGYSCTLLTAYIGVYPAGFVGTPDMVVEVWDDDGTGWPNSLLGSVIVPFASLPTAMGYAAADVSTLNAGNPYVFSDEEDYHIAAHPLDPLTNGLAILMDDGSNLTERRELLTDGVGYYIYPPATTALGFGVDVCCADIPFSDCYTQADWCGIAVYCLQPDPPTSSGNGYGRRYYSQRFTTGGADTLKTIRIALYFWDGAPDLDVIVMGLQDDGYPDTTDVLWSTTILNANLYEDPGGWPHWQTISGIDYVLPPGDEFYVGWLPVLNGPDDAIAGLADGGSCGAMRAAFTTDYFDPDIYWFFYGEFFTDDRNLLIEVDVCADEFDLCRLMANYCDVPAYITGIPTYYPPPDDYALIAGYEVVKNQGMDCRIEKFRVMTYDAGEAPTEYNTNFIIRDSDGPGGTPGTILHQVVVPPGGLNYYPVWNEFDVSAANIRFDMPVYIGVESDAPYNSANPDLYMLRDDGSCGGGTVYLWSDGDVTTSGLNAFMEAFTCCIKPPERECDVFGPGEDWSFPAHDQRRTAASDNNTGNVKAQQAVLWWENRTWTGVTYNGPYARPIIHDTVVVAPFDAELVAYGVNGDQTDPMNIVPNVMWTISGTPYIGSGSFACSPMAYDGYVYFGGAAMRSFTKADIHTGAIIWSRNVANSNSFNGGTYMTAPIILDISGDLVVFVTTAIGEVYALNDADGSDYAGWTAGAGNPIILDGNTYATLSSNGTDVLYVGTNGSNATFYGTLYAIDAATGATIWSLGDGTGLLGRDLDEDTLGTVTTEIFQGPIGVDLDGSIYVMTAFESEMDGAPSGARYRISPSGSVDWGVDGRFPRYSGPIIDAATIYFVALRGWTSETTTFACVDKFSGSVIRESEEFFDGMNWIEGGIDCRLLEADLLYQPNMDAQFCVWNTETATCEFEYNYYDFGYDPYGRRGTGTAIDPDHVVMSNRLGDIFCFTVQSTKGDRPRLRFWKFDEFEPVEPTTYQVDYTDAFMNNGAANLTGSIVADEAAPPAYYSTVTPNRIAKAQKRANAMVDYGYPSMARDLVKAQPDMSSREFSTTAYSRETYSNSAAYDEPDWLDEVLTPTFDIGPSGTFTVSYSVFPDLVTRGPHRCYVTVSSNDNYYINSDTDPTVQYGVLGGCLEAEDVIYFGDGGANSGVVMNTGQLGNQDVAFWDFDGNDAAYWQGGLIYGASKYRIAFNLESWHGGDPADYWNTLLPDANLCGVCPPVSEHFDCLGKIWDDGTSSYVDVPGTVFHYSYVDSIVDYDCHGTGWSWDNTDCGYDNSLTIGLKVNEFMYGAEHAALGNFVIFKANVSNRNNTTLNDIGIGSFNDYDLENNGFDIFKYDEAHAIAFGQSCNAAPNDTWVWGQGTIPMDETNPKHRLYNAHTIDANQGGWHADNIFLDSIYYWMSNNTDETYQPGIDMNLPCDPGSESDDREVWFAFDMRDYGPYETHTIGYYFFGFNDKSALDVAFFQQFAILVNQWAGFMRGDIDRDGGISLSDLVCMFNLLYAGGDGPLFEHLADVNNSGGVDDDDLVYLVDYWFGTGPAPVGDWVLPEICIP